MGMLREVGMRPVEVSSEGSRTSGGGVLCKCASLGKG